MPGHYKFSRVEHSAALKISRVELSAQPKYVFGLS